MPISSSKLVAMLLAVTVIACAAAETSHAQNRRGKGGRKSLSRRISGAGNMLGGNRMKSMKFGNSNRRGTTLKKLGGGGNSNRRININQTHNNSLRTLGGNLIQGNRTRRTGNWNRKGGLTLSGNGSGKLSGDLLRRNGKKFGKIEQRFADRLKQGDHKLLVDKITGGGRLQKGKELLRGNSVRNNKLQLNRKGHGKGKLTHSILQHIKHNQKHHNVCIDHRRWCHTKPKHCHWWYNWCAPIRYCEPVHHVTCHWDYVTCDYSAGGHLVVADARWYLGLKGMLLPGQGVGIETVSPGSPAAHVGLQAGMVITRCNGIDLVDETALADVIAGSGGVLQMDLVLGETGAEATCVVVMQRVASLNY